MNSDKKTLITLQNVFKILQPMKWKCVLAILGLLDTPSDGTCTLNGNRVDHMKLSERA